MNPEPSMLPERDERLGEILADWIESAERGQAPDSAEWLARHAEFAVELQEFLTNRVRLQEAAEPLCQAVRATEMIGRSVGEHDLLEEIGRGGMGLVYRARHRRLQRVVALKMLRANVLTAVGDVQRFRNEAEVLAQLDHPHIVPVHDVGEHEGRVYFSMKLIEGGGLDGQLTRYTNDPRAAARLVAIVARAVHHAHQRGILHRDLKPSNILIDREGHPHVSDFGLAKRMEADDSLTQTGAIVGTPQYMAPEQTRGRKDAVTTATDVYGLGAVLYALLTGKPPFRGETVLETLEQVRDLEPEPPRRSNAKVDRELEAVCLKCLNKDPGRRYASAEAVAEDLERWLHGEPVAARPAGWAERLERWMRRHRPLVLAAIAFLLLALVGLTAAIFLIAREQTQTARARDLALERERALQRMVYAQDISLAWQALREAELDRMRELLDRHIPEVGGEDWRDFEWYYLKKRSHGVLREAARAAAHEGDVYCVVYSPDGQTLASAGKDGMIRLWDSETLQLRKELRSGQGEVNEVVFTPDGKTLASAGDDGTVRLWDIASAKQRAILRMEGRRDELIALAVSPDGKVLAAGGRDGRAWSWDAESGALKAARNLEAGSINYLAFAPDGQTLAGASCDRGVQLLDPVTLREREQFHHPFGWVESVAFSRDGRTLAAGSTWGGSIVLWDRTMTRRFHRPILSGHDEYVNSMSFSPDDTLLASGGSDGHVKLWDVRSGGVLLASVEKQAGHAWCVTFAPDGARLATARQDGTIKLWNVHRDDHRIINMTAEAKNRTAKNWAAFLPIWAAFAPDGQTLITRNQKGELQRWSVLSGRRAEPAGEPEYSGFQPALSSRSRWATVQGDGRDLRVQDLSSAATRVYRHEHVISAVAISAGGEQVAFQDVSSTVWMWEAASGQSRQLARLPQARGGLVVAPDGGMVAVVDSAHVLLLDTASGHLLATLAGHEKEVVSVVFSPDGRQLATCGADGTVRLWDCPSGRERYCLWKHRGTVYAVAFSPDGKTLASAGVDGKVILWGIAGGQELMSLDDHNGEIRALAFSPDGKILAAAGVGGSDGISPEVIVTLWYGEGVRTEP